jgi:hypothetical protein
MYRIYASYENCLCRTGQPLKDLAKALAKARTLPNPIVELRELTASGHERLIAIFQEGHPLGQ